MGAVTIARNGYIQELERERDDIREMYYVLKEDHESLCGRAEGLVEAMRKITSGIYSWQRCVDEIAPTAVAQFYSENAGGDARRAEARIQQGG